MNKNKKNKFILVASLGISALSCGWSAAESEFNAEEARFTAPCVSKVFKRRGTTPGAEDFSGPCDAEYPNGKSFRSMPSPMEAAGVQSPSSLVSPLKELMLNAEGDQGLPLGELEKKRYLFRMEVDRKPEVNPVFKGESKRQSRIGKLSPLPFMGKEAFETGEATAEPAAPKKKKENRTRVPFPLLEDSFSEEREEMGSDESLKRE